MIKIMPPVTRPLNQVLLRRHHPPAAHYSRLRDCLRWEFGFTCAFCLLHESDVSGIGVEGWGTFQVEHLDPQSSHPERVNDYSNLFLICKLCNRARGTYARIGTDDSRLLNACDIAWGACFQAVGDQLLPRGDDPDANYTCETYELNDPRKVRIRLLRRSFIGARLAFLRETQGDHKRLLDQAEDQEDPGNIVLAKRLQRMRRLILEELLRYRAVPLDSNESCFCAEPGACVLPQVLETQTFTLR